MVARHRRYQHAGFPFEWIARSRLRLALLCLLGAAIAAAGVGQAHRNAVRSRALVADGIPVPAVATGRKFGDHARYDAGGRTRTVPLTGAWGDGPPYDPGDRITVYVSRTDPRLVATADGRMTGGIGTAVPVPLIVIGSLVALTAGPGIERWHHRAALARAARRDKED